MMVHKNNLTEDLYIYKYEIVPLIHKTRDMRRTEQLENLSKFDEGSVQMLCNIILTCVLALRF